MKQPPGLGSQDPYETRPAFVAQGTQGIMSALGSRGAFHSAWGPKSSGKVERTHETLT